MSAKLRILIYTLTAVMMTNIMLSVVYGSTAYKKLIQHEYWIAERLADSKSDPSEEISRLNRILKSQLIKGDYTTAEKTVNELKLRMINEIKDTTLLAESSYYIGIYFKLINNYDLTISYLSQTIKLKENIKVADTIYVKSLYNLGGTYSGLGNFQAHKNLTIKAIESGIKVYGPDSHELIIYYASLITAYIELKNYNQALELTDIAYRIADLNEKNADPEDIAYLYGNLGVLFNSIGDYTRSRVFLEKAEMFYVKAGNSNIDARVNLLNSMANSLINLNEPEIAEHYYNKGAKLAMNSYSVGSYQVLRVFAGNLAGKGKVKEGEAVLSDLLTRVIARDGINSQGYYEALTFYANFLYEFNVDDNKALGMYLKCIEYLDTQNDSFLKYYTKLGCALILSERQEYSKSLELLQSLLFTEDRTQSGIDILTNPDIMLLNPDKDLLEVLQTKYLILKKFNHDFPDQKVMEASSKTSELIIALLDRIRISISEEESRLLLGDRYRNSYILVISDFYSLYKQTGKKYYLEKAFEYTEKSKIAGLLTATRQLKATEFHIPEELADRERELQSEIALLNDRISGKSHFENKTVELIQTWKDNLFNTIRERDSLVKVFERDYHGYYSVKYNTEVIEPSMVPDIAGIKTNYISYVASDTNLYITVLNKKYHEIVSVPIDSGFFQKIMEFRRMLSAPDFNNAREDFVNFQKTGHFLFSSLISPVKDYLISDRILISPDNLLSYLPFETLPVEDDLISSLSYKDISYMMEEYDISYTYSATFLAENLRQKKNKGSTAIAFAPDYSEPVDIQSLFQSRQQQGNILYDIPYARAEAEYVSKALGGKLLINGYAKESEFKKEAPDFDIIHLAMHTVLDDDNPMRSTLIFSPDTSGTEDRFLMTYEIYNIPLNARMVVLSSCNTGTGKLFSGEGILSLARGFIYSGSESVVMSMWEIEDRAGTDIVKLYYDYLKKGYSKSMSLRKARIDFLSKADQLRAHPYFWSTLVVYGDNSPLIKPFWPRFLIAVMIIITACLIYYVRKRRYS